MYYDIECPICDIITMVHVYFDDDKPCHCPMCGEDVEAVPTTDDE